MSKLAELLKNLGTDAELAKAYEENPQRVMEDAGLSSEEMTLLKEGDLKKLESVTGLDGLKKITVVIRAFEG
jgi:hypothetical protein